MVYRPLRTAPRMSVMISAIGVSYPLQNLATYFTAIPMALIRPFRSLSQIFQFGSVSASLVTLVARGTHDCLVAALMQIINHTKARYGDARSL